MIGLKELRDKIGISRELSGQEAISTQVARG